MELEREVGRKKMEKRKKLLERKSVNFARKRGDEEFHFYSESTESKGVKYRWKTSKVTEHNRKAPSIHMPHAPLTVRCNGRIAWGGNGLLSLIPLTVWNTTNSDNQMFCTKS